MLTKTEIAAITADLATMQREDEAGAIYVSAALDVIRCDSETDSITIGNTEFRLLTKERKKRIESLYQTATGAAREKIRKVLEKGK